jgi:3-oxoacyl-[acyl-carrier-protein] synthase-3
MMKTLCALIKGVDFYVPNNVVTNFDLSKRMETSDEWITERSGIKERRFVDTDTSTSELGTLAAKKVLDKTGLQAKDLDLILAATLSPDYFFPGIGVQIQNQLGAPVIPAIDIRGQCSGFGWCMATADAFIRAGLYKRVLIVGAELQSRVLDMSTKGRNVSVLFGDGAGAMIVEADMQKEQPSTRNKVRGFIDHILGSDGSGAEQLAILRPGFSKGHSELITVKETEDKIFSPHMEGRLVFRAAVSHMVEIAETLCKRHHIKATDLNLIIPHQANLRINEAVRDKLGVAPEKVFNNIQKYGNTTAATLPIAMTEAEQQGRLKKGDLVMTLVFGSGFTWGANLIRW